VTKFEVFKQSDVKGKIAILASTWFFSGYLPKAPGTWGSLAALPFGALIDFYWGLTGLWVFATALFALGCWTSNLYVSIFGKEDPGEVVIDEVVGIFVVLAFVPLSLVWYAVAFCLFRVFDIVKPFPINLLDRHVKGGLGIMIDDVVAAAYAAAIVFALYLAFTLTN